MGQYLGGPWTLIAPAAGFGIGLVGDMKFMKGLHKRADSNDTGLQSPKDPPPVYDIEVDKSKAELQIEGVAAKRE